jgi:hypothetical protein
MSVDVTAYGADNGHGGRTYDSATQILTRQQAEQAAIAKAANPADLTDDDLKVLPGEVTAELMREGKLAHLGLGRSRAGRRR